ncbi:hypothetical protein BCR44DRAFT_64382 [Catenaria anguillulae PL171]|uniref:Cyclic nucleotide-binding domain-containing protein n=1 Tax=Catenaria anguillulae PL171 TaxID=765915 RepID=A0A1Y2I1R2_9FUNG|nr:hypothetical protein BCR44DRAFT_64382 [Catenaria anguillulae PL171]
MACAWWVVGQLHSLLGDTAPSWATLAKVNHTSSLSGRHGVDWTHCYGKALYWVINIAIIPEFFHVSVKSFHERWVAKALYALAQAYSVWFATSLTSALTNSRACRAAFQRRTKVITDFIQDSNLSQPLRQRVAKYLDHVWSRTNGIDPYTLLQDLPSTLRGELAFTAYGNLLKNVPLFAKADDAFIRAVCMALQPVLFLEGDYIINKDDLGAEMYLVHRGHVQIIAVDKQGKESVISVLRENAYFGEISLYLSRPRTVSVRAATAVDILVLTKQALDPLLKLYPDVRESIIQYAQERLKQDAERGHGGSTVYHQQLIPPVTLEPASVVTKSVSTRFNRHTSKALDAAIAARGQQLATIQANARLSRPIDSQKIAVPTSSVGNRRSAQDVPHQPTSKLSTGRSPTVSAAEIRASLHTSAQAFRTSGTVHRPGPLSQCCVRASRSNKDESSTLGSSQDMLSRSCTWQSESTSGYLSVGAFPLSLMRALGLQPAHGDLALLCESHTSSDTGCIASSTSSATSSRDRAAITSNRSAIRMFPSCRSVAVEEQQAHVAPQQQYFLSTSRSSQSSYRIVKRSHQPKRRASSQSTQNIPSLHEAKSRSFSRRLSNHDPAAVVATIDLATASLSKESIRSARAGRQGKGIRQARPGSTVSESLPSDFESLDSTMTEQEQDGTSRRVSLDFLFLDVFSTRTTKLDMDQGAS